MELKNRHVLVTGADGFIGSHLVEQLLSEGANVKGLAAYNSMGSFGWLDSSSHRKDIEIVMGDVRDSRYCDGLVAGADVIFNLAALIAIPYSYAAPGSYIDTNVNGTLNICQAAISNSCERVIQMSSSEVYGTAKYVPIDEAHPLQAQSPYSASKIAADAVALSFYHSFGLNVVLARPFNTYGPRQSARAVIPTIITQILSGQKSIKMGSLRPTRDFNYVADTCRGLILLAKCDAAVGKTVNIGSNFEISIADVTQKIKDIMNSSVDIVTDEDRIRPLGSEVERLWCDNTLINALTGFRPAYDIDLGLKLTAEWFSDRANLSKYKANIYNV
jgi:NAD dependent epimerase/dehydratase